MINKKVSIRYSVTQAGNLGKVLRKRETWGELVERLSDPIKDKRYTLPEYMNLSLDRQNRRKDVGGFVGGIFMGDKRKSVYMKYRTLLTLDIDDATTDQMKSFLDGDSRLSKYELFSYTTRKHTNENPRWRVVFPLEDKISLEEYVALARIVASRLFKSIKESLLAVDEASFRPTQVMYFPSYCKNAEFKTFYNKGKLLSGSNVLKGFAKKHGSWTNHGNLPVLEGKKIKMGGTGKAAADPRAKSGLVGAFCRSYDVHQVIAEFIPHKYEYSDAGSENPRYTYLGGTTSNGAIVYDNGLFLYSNHSTDPCCGELVNAFDLARRHLFADLVKLESDETEMPLRASYKAMVKKFTKDPLISKELQDQRNEAILSKFTDLDKQSENTEYQYSSDDEDEEPDLSVLIDTAYSTPTFPTELLGDFWEKRVKLWAKNTSAPVDFVIMSLLACVGTLLGNARWVSPKPGWEEPPVLWVLNVGNPSTNKSPAIGVFQKLLTSIETTWDPLYDEELMEYYLQKRKSEIVLKSWDKALQNAISNDDSDLPTMPPEAWEPTMPVRKRTFVNDITIEALITILEGNPRGLLVLKDEVASLFENMSRYTNGTDRPFWLEANGGRSYRKNRVKDGHKAIIIPHLSLGIVGGIQPERLKSFLTSADDGLQARFIYVWPDVKRKRMSPSFVEDNRALDALKRVASLQMCESSDAKKVPQVLPFTKSAMEHFVQWVYERSAEETPFDEGILKSAYGKANGVVARIAIILEHLSWCAESATIGSPEAIKLATLKNAIRIRDEYIKPMQIKTFGANSKSKGDLQLMGLLAFIQKNNFEPFTVRELRRSSVSRLSGLELKVAFDVVERAMERNWLTPHQSNVNKMGRPKIVYHVHRNLAEGVKSHLR